MSREQLVHERYARWLETATRLTFSASLAAFVVYATGLLPAFVPLEALPRLWHLPVAEYLARTGLRWSEQEDRWHQQEIDPGRDDDATFYFRSAPIEKRQQKYCPECGYCDRPDIVPNRHEWGLRRGERF